MRLRQPQARRHRRRSGPPYAFGAILAAGVLGLLALTGLIGDLQTRAASLVAPRPSQGPTLQVERTGTVPSPPPTVAGSVDLGPPAPKVGSPAPSIRVPDLRGQALDLAQFRGKVVLLNFWASWCKPCEAEMADLQILHTEQAARGFTVIAMNEGEEPARAAEFFEAKGITFPSGLDLDMKVTRDWQVFGLPNTFLIDANGVVRDRVVGPLTLDQMRARVAKVLDGQAIERPRLIAVSAAMAGQNDQPAAEVLGATVTVGDVNRRLDLENALGILRGGLAPEFSTEEGRALLEEQQRAMVERIIDERIVAARARAVGLAVPESEITTDVERLASEAGLDVAGLERELAAVGSSIDLLRESQRQARQMGAFTLDYVLTGRTPEKISDFGEWLARARSVAGARVLLQ